MKTLLVTAIGSLILLFPALAYADSAQWNLNPTSGDWNTADNWTPMTVPNGSGDVATFDLSNTTNVSISVDTEVSSITFTLATTNPYSITASPELIFTISGVGITNNSGIAQEFVTAVDGSGNFGRIVFTDTATAGTAVFTNNGSTFSSRGGIQNSTTLRLLAMRVSLTVTARAAVHLRRPFLTPPPRPVASLPMRVALPAAHRLQKVAKRSSSTPPPRLMALLSTTGQR